MKTCNKCGKEKIVGICSGCGEYATYAKCTCEPKKQGRIYTKEELLEAWKLKELKVNQ